MAALSFTWALGWAGSANLRVADELSEAVIHASYISPAPDDLIYAVTQIVLGAREARIQFELEPGAARWIFHHHGDFVDVDVLFLKQGRLPDSTGTVMWESRRQTVDALARGVIRGFDQIVHEHGEAGYLSRWRSPFPRAELEALRAAWRDTVREDSGQSEPDAASGHLV